MKTAPPLPAFLASAISSIRWPLNSADCLAMNYQPLDEMRAMRTSHDVPRRIRLDDRHPLLTDLPQEMEHHFPCSQSGTEQRDFGVLATAAILLGNGLADECHDLVTPMSFPDDMHFNHGPAIYSQVTPAVRSYATYLHALVHRQEGYHHGEFGMNGWENAMYWANAAMRSPGVQELPHGDWFAQAAKLIRKYNGDEVKKWNARHKIATNKNALWEPEAGHDLAQSVMTTTARQDTIGSAFREFAETMCEMELRVILAHCLQRAGYQCTLADVLNEREHVAVGGEL